MVFNTLDCGSCFDKFCCKKSGKVRPRKILESSFSPPFIFLATFLPCFSGYENHLNDVIWIETMYSYAYVSI